MSTCIGPYAYTPQAIPAYVCCNLVPLCAATLHSMMPLCQAQGPQEPAQEAPRQICAGSGAAQGPGARRAASPRQCTRVCWRGHGYQVTGGQEHAPGLMCALGAPQVPSCIYSYCAALSSKRVNYVAPCVPLHLMCVAIIVGFDLGLLCQAADHDGESTVVGVSCHGF